MFGVTVQDHMMVAHSLPDPFFGPAQNMHGATYVVQVRLNAPQLNVHGVVIDIGAAAGELAAIVADLNYRNLDVHPTFAGVLTTTEVLARHVAERMAERLAEVEEQHICAVEVTLQEHPNASASYSLQLAHPAGDEHNHDPRRSGQSA